MKGLLYIITLIYINLVLFGYLDFHNQQTREICCYYRQHYHNAYCNNPTNETFGCVLGPALVTNSPVIKCSSTGECLPGMMNQGYWLEGFKYKN